MRPQIKQFEATEWPLLAAEQIQDSINAILHEQGKCSVMLTGGRSAERLYAGWAGLLSFQQMTGVQFYFGDERCVPPSHAESNYGMAIRTLFYRGVPAGCSVFRIEAEYPDRESAAKAYEKLLPEMIDVLLLGMGTDGHIASLFPHSPALRETQRTVVPIRGPKPPSERLTITPKVIASARSIFLLATGEEKGRVLAKSLNTPEDSMALPVCLTLNGICLLDCDAGKNITL
jgi:6-phosphogluconolactonase